MAKYKSKLNSLVGLLLLAGYGSIALSEINHISQTEIDSIKQEFDSAQPVSINELESSKWDCSMIGVRSALQKLDRIRLYNFKSSAQASLENSGSHTIAAYHIEAGELQGTNSAKALTERLRINKNQELIGRLSKTGESGSISDIAYSKCKQL